MRNRSLGSMIAMAAVMAVLPLAPVAAAGQGPKTQAGCPEEPARFHPCATAKAKTFNPPRTPDGKPDLQGFWNRFSSNIEEHPPESPPGTSGAIAGGPSLIVDPADGKIPYQPWAVAKRKENFEQYIAPIAQCFLPGVPHQVHTGGGFRIVQPPGSGYVVFLSEFYGAYRSIPTDGRAHVGEHIRLWQGDSRGHWEGNTLVVDVTNVNARTWLDRVGNFYSDAAHVVERWTLVDADAIHYEATIEDPKVFTRPWKMAFGITRNKQTGYELMEQACHEGDRDTAHLRSLGYKTYRGVVPRIDVP